MNRNGALKIAISSLVLNFCAVALQINVFFELNGQENVGDIRLVQAGLEHKSARPWYVVNEWSPTL